MPTLNKMLSIIGIWMFVIFCAAGVMGAGLWLGAHLPKVDNADYYARIGVRLMLMAILGGYAVLALMAVLVYRTSEQPSAEKKQKSIRSTLYKTPPI